MFKIELPSEKKKKFHFKVSEDFNGRFNELIKKSNLSIVSFFEKFLSFYEVFLEALQLTTLAGNHLPEVDEAGRMTESKHIRLKKGQYRLMQECKANINSFSMATLMRLYIKFFISLTNELGFEKAVAFLSNNMRKIVKSSNAIAVKLEEYYGNCDRDGDYSDFVVEIGGGKFDDYCWFLDRLYSVSPFFFFVQDSSMGLVPFIRQHMLKKAWQPEGKRINFDVFSVPRYVKRG